jgi:hypothetical protein
MTANTWCKTPSGARSLLAFLIIILLTLPAIAQTQTPIYPILPYNFALFPQANATFGDFNGDGRIDEATPNGDNDIALRLNNNPNSSPGFVDIQLTCQPQSIVAADLNNDTKIDLAFSCQTPNQPAYVGVILGNGDGAFQAASYYAVPGAASLPAITTVDLNGDGYLDVAVIENNTAVGVLLNQGNSKPGSLFTASLYAAPVGVSLSTISAGDFNGDGKQDIVAGISQLVTYSGNGDGTLNAAQLTTASILGDQPFVTGDFNRDGLTDVAFLISNAQGIPTSLQVLLGDPSGKFVTGSALTLDPSVNYRWIVPFQNTSTSNITNFALIGNVTSIALNDGNGGLSLGESYGTSNFVVAQTGSNGNTNLYVQSNVESVILTGNGNATFQGPKATLLGGGVGTPVVADINSDGLADVLSLDAAGNLVAALGRGNGAFSITSCTPSTGQLLVTGDFNGDGKLDAIAISPGVNYTHDGTPIYQISTGQLFFYSGNGDGTFQPSPAPVDIKLSGAATPLVGDFNGDGKLDLIIPYNGFLESAPGLPPSTGTLFFAGNGGGTFAAPVSTTVPYTSTTFVADLNNDGKLDIIGDDTVSLGNGDGTFQQQPLGIDATILAVGDLNGDGKPDLVIGTSTSVALYAGHGDGTFQTTPFYTPTFTTTYSTSSGIALVSIGDVNADGHPDLLVQYGFIGIPGYEFAVILGDGTGNFANNLTYSLPNNLFATTNLGTFARVNNQAPIGSSDHALDYLFGKAGTVTSLLNQLNPAPLAPAPLPSKTVLAASASSAAPGQQLTLTATVTGATPTGTVSFVTNGKTLGTATITNGTATLATSFATAATYPIIANYPGDANNTPSSSNAVSIVVVPVNSTTTLSISAASAGTNQQLTLTASVSGLNPTGTVTFASAGTTLGTASVANGVATLPFTFTAVGSYAVTASYAGDVANLSSVSAPVTVTIAEPGYSITASPSSATIKAGQSATTTLTVNTVGNYAGTVKLSCGTLTAGVACNFAPSSVTPSTGPATSVLTVTTTAPTTALLRNLSVPLQGIAWASVLLLILSPRRIFGLNRRLARATLLTLLLAAGLLSFSGCSSSSPSTPVTNPGTPAGIQTVTLNATDSSGSLSHVVIFQVTVQ